LDGRRVGSAWMARCPAHDDREPSLSIGETRDGKVLVHCHAGCDQHLVIAALKARGIWGDLGRALGTPLSWRSDTTNEPDEGDAARTRAALRIWKGTLPAHGPLVEPYLGSRNIVIPIPATLRFHPGIKHPGGQRWPAMVALVTRGDNDAPLAV